MKFNHYILLTLKHIAMKKKKIAIIFGIFLVGFLIYLFDNISSLIQGFKTGIGF